MKTCPVCGWVLQTGEIKTGGFACPGCNERLRIPDPPSYVPLHVVATVLAIVIPYVARVEGFAYLITVVILLYAIVIVGAAIMALFAQVERDWGRGNISGRILDIPDPPDSPRK